VFSRLELSDAGVLPCGIPKWTVDLDWGQVKNPNTTVNTAFKTKRIDGLEYGGLVLVGKGTTSDGAVEYRLEAMARRIDKEGSIDVRISSTMPDHHFEQAGLVATFH